MHGLSELDYAVIHAVVVTVLGFLVTLFIVSVGGLVWQCIELCRFVKKYRSLRTSKLVTADTTRLSTESHHRDMVSYYKNLLEIEQRHSESLADIITSQAQRHVHMRCECGDCGQLCRDHDFCSECEVYTCPNHLTTVKTCSECSEVEVQLCPSCLENYEQDASESVDEPVLAPLDGK